MIPPVSSYSSKFRGDVFDDMEQFVGQFEARSVRHRYEMPFVKGNDLALDMRNGRIIRVVQIRFVVQRDRPRFGAIRDALPFIDDLDPVMQRKDFGRGKQRTERLTEALDVIDVRVLARLAVSQKSGKNAHAPLLSSMIASLKKYYIIHRADVSISFSKENAPPDGEALAPHEIHRSSVVPAGENTAARIASAHASGGVPDVSKVRSYPSFGYRYV